MVDSGITHAEAKVWIEFEGDDESELRYATCEHCNDELPPEACAARRGAAEVPYLTFSNTEVQS